MSGRKKPEFDHAAFSERLISLGIYSAELAQIIGRDAALIDRWREGRAKPDADELVLLRVLDSDHAATLAIERVRQTRTLPLRSGSGTAAGVEPPYGSGHQGETGGRPR